MNFKPTESMAVEARRGLEWRREYKRGGTAIGVARARDISNRANLSAETIGRMVSYFARHEVDKKAEGFTQGEKGYPSAGRIAWALWGGDDGNAWAKEKYKQIETNNFMLEIVNKSAKVKLNDQVDKYSIDRIIEEIDQSYGMKGVEENFAIGEVIACAENAIDTLTVEIHTGGGSVFDGYRLYNSMQELRSRGVVVTARINTLAASMGSVIAMAADNVEIASNGRMMIHEASLATHGDAEKMRQAAELLEGISDEIAGIYATKTGKTQKEMRAMMKKETWMTAKQAVDAGFADKIFDTKASSMASILDRFKPDAALTEKVIGLESAIVDAENQIIELEANLATRESDLQNAVTELAEVKASNEEITAKLAESESALQSEKEAVIAKASEIDSLNAKLVEVEADANAKLAEAENSAARKAAEILAMAGVPPVDNTGDNGRVNVVTRDEFNAMTIMQRNEYMRNGGKIN
jgi:ATP-dependent protease ClpP protease subunit